MKNIRGKLSSEKIDLGEMIPWDTQGAEAIIHGLMRCLDIEEDIDKQRKTATGEAWANERLIHIPACMNTPQKFIVGLHEIGHIKFAGKSYKYDYLMEYDAEIYAITLAQSFGFIKKRSLDAYIRRAKSYILSYITRDLKIIGIENIPLEIIQWIDDPELNKKYHAN